MEAVGHTLGDFGSKMAVICERGVGGAEGDLEALPHSSGCDTGTTFGEFWTESYQEGELVGSRL